jgi:hypothetical protein
MTTFVNRHPALRSASIALGAVGVWSIIAAAALAVALIVQNERRSAPAAAVPTNGSVHANGLVVLSPLSDAKAFNDTLGFEPVVPGNLPDLTQTTPRFFAVQADDGVSEGQVRFAPQTEASPEGIRGPGIVLIERGRAASDAVDSILATAIAGTSRIFTSNVACGSLTVTVQLYFYSSGADGPPATAAASPGAEAFLSALRAQCAS